MKPFYLFSNMPSKISRLLLDLVPQQRFSILPQRNFKYFTLRAQVLPMAAHPAPTCFSQLCYMPPAQSPHHVTALPIPHFKNLCMRIHNIGSQFKLYCRSCNVGTQPPLSSSASADSVAAPAEGCKKEKQGYDICEEVLAQHDQLGVVWTALEIAEAVGGQVMKPAPPGTICTDSRKIQPGQWFLALTGPRFDGHDFLQSASAKGCAGVVGNRTCEFWPRGFVKVEGSTLTALQRLGFSARKRFRGPVVGITGSVGKTTTRTMTALALESLGPIHQTSGNQNNHVGVPLTLLSMPLEAKACVLELGMNHVGEIEELVGISEPGVRVVLNVGPAHMENFKSLEEVARAKGEILIGARPGDVCVLNADDPLVMGLPIPDGVQKVLFGSKLGCDVRLIAAEIIQGSCAVQVTLEHCSSSKIELAQDGLQYKKHFDYITALPIDAMGGETNYNSQNLTSMASEKEQILLTDSELEGAAHCKRQDSRVVFEIPSPGIHLAMNACAAAAVAVSLGIPLEQAGKSLSNFSPVNMRLSMETVQNGITIINDVYNANPMSMVAALKLLHSLDCQGRKVAVLGDMLELGISGKNAHLDLLKMCQEIDIQLLGVAGLHFMEAIKAVHLASAKCSVLSASNSESLASQIRTKLNVGDVVLVKGSRGMRMEVVVDVIKEIHI